jgi:hypothetical protein
MHVHNVSMQSLRRIVVNLSRPPYVHCYFQPEAALSEAQARRPYLGNGPQQSFTTYFSGSVDIISDVDIARSESSTYHEVGHRIQGIFLTTPPMSSSAYI